MKSTVRTLQLFELIAEVQPVSLAELAARCDMPKSNLQRSVLALAEAGWVRKAARDRTSWELSPRILAVARRASGENDLREIAMKWMHQLRNEVNETVQLLIPDGLTQMVCIERVESTQAVRTNVALGETMPFASTSTGMAVLSRLPPADIDAVLERGVTQLTEKTVVDLPAIREELELVRRRGYAINKGQNRPGVCAIGAPVIGGDGRPIAAICISIPETRFERKRVNEWATALISAATRIGDEYSRLQ
jgi:IclR family acetate operon transcriptional repressor